MVRACEHAFACSARRALPNQEVCNIVVFYVRDWDALGQLWNTPPKTTTVTLTRRGTLTLRLTWDGVEWRDNREVMEAARVLQGFVKGLVY